MASQRFILLVVCPLIICMFFLSVECTRVNSIQVSKLGPLVYYKHRAKVTTAEPSTESNSQGYDNQEYYTENSLTTEAATSTEPAPSKPSHGSNDADFQMHIDALVKLLLQTKSHSPKFLLLLPLMPKGKPTYPIQTSTTAATDSPVTVKPKPRKKIKYIVV